MNINQMTLDIVAAVNRNFDINDMQSVTLKRLPSGVCMEIWWNDDTGSTYPIVENLMIKCENPLYCHMCETIKTTGTVLDNECSECHDKIVECEEICAGDQCGGQCSGCEVVDMKTRDEIAGRMKNRKNENDVLPGKAIPRGENDEF